MSDLVAPPQWRPERMSFLLAPLNPLRVLKSEDEEQFSYLAIWDIKRQMIRAFGVGGWDTRTSTTVLEKIRHAPRPSKALDRTLWTVIYHAKVQLTVRDDAGKSVIKEGEGIGAARLFTDLAKAYSSALAKALAAAYKHAAVELGDQFGLSLYDNGSLDPVVRDVAVRPDGWDPDNPSPRVIELIASDKRVGPEVTLDRVVGQVPTEVAPDVEAFFGETEGWTAADVEARIEEAHDLGISDRFAGTSEDGRPLTVDDLILIIGMRQVRAQLDQAAAAEPPVPDDPAAELPAGEGTLGCGCDAGTVASSGQHGVTCTRSSAVLAGLDAALSR